MTFVEKYDRLIQLIETSITEKKNNIPRYLSANLGINVRHIEDAFAFITDQTLTRYIHERLLVNMINSCKAQNMTLEKMAELYGRDASSLSRTIKNQFGKPFSVLTPEDMEHYQPWTFSRLMKYEETEKMNETEESENMEEPEPPILSEKPDQFFETLFRELDEYKEPAASHAREIEAFPDDVVEYARQLRKIYDIGLYRTCAYVKNLERLLYYVKDSETGNIRETVKQQLSEYEEKAVFLLSVRHSMRLKDALLEVRRLQAEGITDVMAEGEDFMEILSYLSDMNAVVPGKEIRHMVKVMNEYGVAVPASWQLLEDVCREHKTIEEMLQTEKYRFLICSDPDWEPEIDVRDLYRETYDEAQCIEESDCYDEQEEQELYERLENLCYGHNQDYDDMEDMDDYIERVYAFSEFGEDADPETNPQFYDYIEMEDEDDGGTVYETILIEDGLENEEDPDDIPEESDDEMDYEMMEEDSWYDPDAPDDMEEMDDYIERMFSFSEFGDDRDPETNPWISGYEGNIEEESDIPDGMELVEDKYFTVAEYEKAESYDDLRNQLGLALYSRETAMTYHKETDMIYCHEKLPGGIIMFLEVFMQDPDGDLLYHIPVDTERVVYEVLDIDEMFEDAYECMPQKMPPIIEKASECVSLSFRYETPDFYVVHTGKVFGASAFWYPGVQEEISEMLGGNYFVLPLTKDFLIVAADDGTKDPDSLQELLAEHNGRLDPEERLTNDVLYYVAAAKELTTVNDIVNASVAYQNETGAYEN